MILCSDNLEASLRDIGDITQIGQIIDEVKDIFQYSWYGRIIDGKFIKSHNYGCCAFGGESMGFSMERN